MTSVFDHVAVCKLRDKTVADESTTTISMSSYVYTPMDDSIRAMAFRIVAHMARPAPTYPYRMDRGSVLAQVAALATPPLMLSLPPTPRLPADYECVGPMAPLVLHPEPGLVDTAIDMGGLLDAEEWFTWAPVAAPAGLPAKVRVRLLARAFGLPLPKHYPLPVVAVIADATIIKSIAECAAAPAAEEFGTSDAVEVDGTVCAAVGVADSCSVIE
ncbi:hypothetical protein GGF32_003758 [Allomyces javanicus]|nr:hypothetical protein GGF32_003758 [Allomyces javanicus]